MKFTEQQAEDDDRMFISSLFENQSIGLEGLQLGGGFHLTAIGLEREKSRSHYQSLLPGGVAKPIICCIKCRRTMWRNGFTFIGIQSFQCIRCGFSYALPLRINRRTRKPIQSRNQGHTDNRFFTPRSKMTPDELREHNRNRKAKWRERAGRN